MNGTPSSSVLKTMESHNINGLLRFVYCLLVAYIVFVPYPHSSAFLC